MTKKKEYNLKTEKSKTEKQNTREEILNINIINNEGEEGGATKRIKYE